MKEYLTLTTTLAALLPLAGSAQTVAPNAPPQAAQPAIPPTAPAPPAPPARHSHWRDQEPKEPVTYLGIESSDVPRVLSAQMGLQRGFGVVVDYVAPNTPAATAGIQPNDIIKMLNDQIIVDPSQLGKLIRSFSEGTTVNLTLLRKGQEMKVSVKLAKHDVSASRTPFGGFEKEWRFDDLGKMNFEWPDMSAVKDAVQRAKDQAVRASDEARKAASRLRIVTTDDDDTTRTTKVDLGNATISFSDEHGELKIERVNGKKMLSATDSDGKVIFQGPIDTEEQRAKVPPNVRERVEKLEKQDLPEVPEAPGTPEPPDNDDDDDTAQLKVSHVEPAGFLPNEHRGWRRSTILL